MMNSLIYLRRANRVVLAPGEAALPPAYLATLHRELEVVGYTLSPALEQCLLTHDAGSFTAFYELLLDQLRELRGAHVQWRPLYPGFPAQVMQASEAALYLNAVAHYLTSGRWRPSGAQNATPLELAEEARRAYLRTIDLGSTDDFERIFTRLAGARSSLSETDKEDLAWFVHHYGARVYDLMPAQFLHQENLAVLGAALLRADIPLALAFLGDKLQTATDVLRLAVALGGGDVSLAAPSKFGRMARPMRRWLLSMLERCPAAAEDMARRPEVFKRLGEALHPGEHAKRFPNALAAFSVIRDGVRLQTFNHRIEHQFETAAFDDALALLSTRPGELVRRLDHLLRSSPQPDAVLARFAEVADRASTAVLLQAMVHLRRRDEVRLRSFFPKGEVARVFATADTRAALPREHALVAANVCEQALLRRFATLPALGRCYVAPELVDYLVPFSQRSAAKALRTLVRGSRLPMPDSAVVRLFLWWKNGRSRTDIDLSAALYDAEFKFLDVLSYYNLKSYGGCHSGDIVDAPKGAAEFIDLDIALLRERGVRYMVSAINSYTVQPFCDLPECFAGWMARDGVGSGQTFEPSTVLDKVDIASASTICLPVIFDLQARQLIWADIALTQRPSWNNLQNNLSGVSVMLRALSGLIKPDLQTLFSLHARARGQEVDNAVEADTVFSPHDGITPFDLDRIRADFM